MTDRPTKSVDGVAVPLTDAEWADYQARAAAFVPPSAPVPVATPYQITLALNLQGTGPAAAFDAAVAKAKPSDRMRWNARTDPIPADNPVYVRLCGLAGIDPGPVHALAVQQ